jgi:DNA-binding MarR family transcriptional regulator
MSSCLTTSRHIGQLLRDAYDDFEAELVERTPAFHGAHLRPTHNAVLRYLDRDGTRASELARRSGLTRQALSLIVAELERYGVVERRDDPSDRRAKIVTYTEHGREAFDASRAIIAAIDARYEERVGAEEYAALKRALAKLPRD